MNAKIFVNYRREDTAPYAGRLYDHLIARFGEDQVFIDIDQIEPGEDFVEVINRKVGTCDIAIVAIGPRWLGAIDTSGTRRLDDEEDFVRMEIVAALERKIRVIPVLVGGAHMPRKQELPEALAPLSRRNAIELSETRFHADVNRLIAAIEKSFALMEKQAELSATPVAPPAEPASVRPPESKDLPDASESAKPAEPELTDQENVTQFNLRAESEYGQGVPKDLGKAADRVAEKETELSATPVAPPAESASVRPPESKDFPDASESAKPAEPKLADQGNATEQFDLGFRYQTGDGVPQDLQKAAELYQKAADQGHAYAQYSLGTLYKTGEGVPKDLSKAADLYQKAADQGYALGQYDLGRLYETGEGVPHDLRKAAELYQKTADQGYALAQFYLGKLYEYGEGVPQDLRKAAELYQNAADQGNSLGQYNLGKFYEYGNGMPQDLHKAAELYQQAADEGYPLAQFYLGLLYERGHGVPQDLHKARELYQRAADQGNATAISKLKELSRQQK